MTDTTTQGSDIDRMPLKSMGLKPGMALQTRRLVAGATKKESQYYGAIEGKGVMVAPLGVDSSTELNAGEVCVVRGFTGQYEFSFLSKVLQTFEKPFVYALLAYPAQVDARKVRQSMRTRVSWPCNATLIGKPQEPALQVNLVDLSPFGAMIRSQAPFGAIGEALLLEIHAELDQSALQLVVRANICHNNRSNDDDGYLIGMAFTGLNPEDKQLLTHLTQSTAGQGVAS